MSAWTEDTWDGFCLIVEEAWPGEFGDSTRIAWRILLDDYDPDQALGAVKRLVAKGGRFRPAVSELAAEIRDDPSRPTFEEAYRLLFGPDGVCSAVSLRGRLFDSAAEMRRAELVARRQRCEEVHPLVGSFAERFGIDRLVALELDDPQYGAIRLKELKDAWDRHCEAVEGREVAALVSGRRGELARFDPLAVLPGPRRELEASER